MPELRLATPRDAALITAHRHQMYTDNGFATEARLADLDAAFEPWVRARLHDGRYVGLLLEEDGVCVAAAGIFFAEFPPHYLDLEPIRPYLLNFYTAHGHRGHGYAKQLVQACIDECRKRGHGAITLHASKFGRPVYERFGFVPTNEMMRLDTLLCGRESIRRSWAGRRF